MLEANGNKNIKIITKIERAIALKNLDEILKVNKILNLNINKKL